MKREIKDKLISAAAVTLFFAAVRPSAVPAMWITVLLAFMLYEGILLGMALSRDIRKAQAQAHEPAVSVRGRSEVGGTMVQPAEGGELRC